MELYGSLLNISGSVTASSFTGSFIGDGSGLSGIQASGVTGLNLSQISSGNATASISSTGFKVNKNTQIEGNLSVTGALIATEYIVSSSVTYMTTSFASGSSAFGNDNNDVHQFTGSVQITGSISLNGQAIGTGKLDETTFQSYTSSNDSRVSALETSSGSLNSFTSSINTTIKSKLDSDNVISGSVQVDITDTTNYSTFSSSLATLNLSQNNRLDSIEATTNSLNNFSYSINTTIKDKLNVENIVSSSTQISLAGTSGYTTFSSSLATTDLGQDNRLNSLETTSGSLNTFTSSVTTRFGNIETSTSSLNTFSSSTNTRLSAIETSTGSLNTFSASANDRLSSLETASGSIRTDFNSYTSSNDSTNTTQNNRLSSLESTTSSLNLYTSSNNTVVGTLQTATSSLNSYTSSNITNINAIHTATSSLNSYTSSNNSTVSTQNSRLTTIESATSSLNTFTSSTNSRLGSIETSTGALNIFSSSANTRLTSIETSTGSLNSFTSSIDTTIKNKLNTDGIISGSIQVSLSQTTGYDTFSSSLAITDLGQDNRLNSLEGKTGSYAITGSNKFIGDQIITGSMTITQNLMVLGSSSIVYSTASQLIVEDNIIVVNASFPAQRFAGLEVHDSGSNGSVTASLLWDGQNNRWVYQNSSEAHYGGAMLIAGPRNTGSLGDELTLTNGKIPKSIGGDHIGDSIINETNDVIYITGALSVTGTVSGTNITAIESTTASLNSYTASNNTNISAIHTATASLNSFTSSTSNRLNSIETSTGSLNTFSASANNRLNSLETATSSLNTFTSSINTTIKNRLNAEGVVSGSSQVSFNGITDKPTLVSGSSQIAFGSITGVPSGLVSGSSQVLAGTTIHSGAFFNGITVVSGSAQVSFNGITDKPALVSGSSQVSFNGITDKPTLVSGSSQITYSGISSIPSGIVSGSSQITFSGISSIPSGLVSGSSQVSYPSLSNIPSGIVSGSSQVSYTGLSNIPSGIVSGSAQLTSTFVQKAGDTVTGTIYSTYNSASGRTNLGFNVGKNILGNLHVQNGSGAGNDNSNQAAITFQGGTASEAQAGIYVLNNSSYGTSMGFATTNSYSSGPQLFMVATNGGVVDFPRARPTYAGNTILDAANYTSYAMAGAGYSANQNLNTTSAVTFAGITNNGAYSGSGGSFSHNIGNPAGTTELFVHNGANTPVPFRMTKAGYTGAGGSYGILQLYMNDNTNGNGSNLYFCANSSNGTFTEYAGIGMQIKSNTAGSETARLYFYRQARAVSGTFDSNGDLYTVSNIYTNGNGTTTGNLVLNSSNYTSYAMQGAGYSANQNLSTSSTVQFGSLGVGVSPALTVHFRGSNEMVRFENTSTSSGQYCQLNMRAGNRNAYLWIGNENSSSWAGAGGLNIYTENGNIDLWSNAVQRVRLQTDGHLVPYVNNTYDLGSASLGWRNVYTNDLHLSNMNKPEGNDVDGTNGNWTIQEGAENLYIINNNNGKKFKISLEEII